MTVIRNQLARKGKFWKDVFIPHNATILHCLWKRKISWSVFILYVYKKKKFGVEINAEILFMSCWQNVEKNHNMKVVNKSIENVWSSGIWGTTLRYCIHDNIKSRLNSENYCGHLDQIHLSSCLLCKSIRINIPGSVIWPHFSRWCEKRSLNSEERTQAEMFENRVLMNLFCPKREEGTRGLRHLHDVKPPDLFSPPNIFRETVKQNDTDGACRTLRGE